MRMSDEAHLPNPAVTKHKTGEKPLDLKNVDTSRDGVQGDAVVSRGRASTFVTKLPHERGNDE
jgi:hypothetical protein